MLGGQVEVESNGAWVTTSDGEKYLNAGGYGVFLHGSRHPTVVAEVERQLRTHPIYEYSSNPPPRGRPNCSTSVTPDGMDRVFFANSGAEATEAAIKIARRNGRRHLISMQGGYHGKTLGALSVTAKDVFQRPFRPLLPDVTHVPFGDATALAAALDTCPDRACVIVEPIQGEAGVADRGWIPGHCVDAVHRGTTPCSSSMNRRDWAGSVPGGWIAKAFSTGHTPVREGIGWGSDACIGSDHLRRTVRHSNTLSQVGYT